jgi:hypothetical protein
MIPTSDADLGYITAYGGVRSPYRRALLEAFHQHATVPHEIRIASLLELAVHRMDGTCDDCRQHLAERLYGMADALALKGPET